MPVTKTAKRALRSSKEKETINKIIMSRLEAAIRTASKDKREVSVRKAVSLVDRASKKRIIHKNKASRVKSRLAKLLPKSKSK